MKTEKIPDEHSKKFAIQLKEHFSEEEIASFVLSILGMSDLAHIFIWEKVKDFIEIPIEVKYSTLQHASYYRLLSSVARGTLKEEGFEVSHMPVDEQAWQSKEDFEKRFIFVVKNFYDLLKKEGKL